MTPEERQMLAEAHSLAKENNELLQGLVRSNRRSTVLRAVYWLLIIGLSFGSILVIKPFISAITGDLDGGAAGGSWTDALQSFKDLQGLK